MDSAPVWQIARTFGAAFVEPENISSGASVTNPTGTGETQVPMETVLQGLNDLLQLDHDAVGAYDVALEAVEDGDHALRIEAFRQDHERHIRDLNDVILALGGVPANEPHATAPLRQTLQEMAASGSDEALLTTWHRSEDRFATTYTDYARKAVFWPAAAKRVIDQNALDEEKHLRWVEGVLGVASGSSERKTEGGMERAKATLAEVQDRLQVASAKGKAGVAGTLATAANRLDQFAVDQQSDAGIKGTARRAALKLSDSLESAALALTEPDEDRPGGGIALPEQVELAVRERPVAMVAGAFVAAFVLGRILR